MEKGKIHKRSLVVFSILLVVGVVSYMLSNSISIFASSSVKREIAKEIQKIKKIGEPTTIKELIPVEIPDEENGALVYREAFKIRKDLAKKYKKEEKYIPYEGTVTWDKVPEAEKKRVRNLLLYNSDFLKYYQLLEKASHMKCQFLKRKDWEKGMEILLPHLAQVRSCARLLAARAKLQAEEGNIEEALNTSLIGLRVSKSLSDEPIIINQLVRIAIDRIMLREIEETSKKKEASIKMYQSLIKEVDEERSDMMIYPSLLGERVVFGMIEFPRLRGSKEYFSKLMERIKDVKIYNRKRFIDENKVTYLQTVAKMISLVKRPYWETGEELKGFDKEMQKLPQEKALLAQILVPALFRAYKQEARIDAQLVNAEIALACHIYKAKYKDYPDSLDKLTPEILPSLLLDPFTGKNYIYKRKNRGFIVYSVGDNLKDDGGKFQRKMRWEGDFDIVWEE